jgi:Tfp pilus assembly protein PilN
MTHLAWLLIVWGVLTAVLIVLLIYRGTLNMREDDQLFLDESESHMALEQADVLRRINQISPVVRVFGAASGMWIYQGFTQVQ